MAAHPPHSDAGAKLHSVLPCHTSMQGANAGMLTACKLGLACSDVFACTPSTSIVSGAAASGGGGAAAAAAAGLAAHAFCAAGCAGALLKKPNMLCWPCLALLPACHSLLHFSACSSLLNLLLNFLLQPTTGHSRSSILTFQTECYPQSSSRHNSSTVPPDIRRGCQSTVLEPRIPNV